MVVSDTGPLISIFQSDSLDVFTNLFGTIHSSTLCRLELIEHRWGDAIEQADSSLVFHVLSSDETMQASEYAIRIAKYTRSNVSEAQDHIGEGEVIALAQREDFAESLVLIDERAARIVAKEEKLALTGFAGALLVAVEEGLISADDLRQKLLVCQLAGTHYSNSLISQFYEQAKGTEE